MIHYLVGEVLDSWERVRDLFPDHTCQWQDLDGFHHAPMPPTPPSTSLLHGWDSEGTTLIRVRWDGDRAFVARLSQDPEPLGKRKPEEVQVRTGTTVAWGALGQVAQARGPAAQVRHQVFEHLEVPDTGQGGLLFIRPGALP
ncbi:hypothetical protein [Ornithinimicrobium avium]|uniref:Uncharacterized protein n=1 Tax=Ornithinimicrobium avium TaxID=2283195 RepID=A0A345NLQ2_9MICO|nr:hypothetical protein [Ornithinimicrobium avium]AXH95960.1 hypothetical protein DV701_07340 [Ornithinimicrobium avium]